MWLNQSACKYDFNDTDNGWSQLFTKPQQSSAIIDPNKNRPPE
ncbi:hypothetical protein N644_2368 [Lactiplantibacillus paraplantarum]|nr:hypothetical protein N644_2368 [Lactiplantibacillus paraplantarum]